MSWIPLFPSNAMSTHPGELPVGDLRAGIQSVLARLSPEDITAVSLSTAADEIASIGEAFVQTIDEFDWSSHGWHLVGVDRLVREYARTVRHLAEVESERELQSVDCQTPERIAKSLIAVGSRLVGPLRILGTRTSNWVEIYSGLGDIVRAFGWALDLNEHALTSACSALSGLPDEDQRRQFTEMMERAFQRANVLFRCS